MTIVLSVFLKLFITEPFRGIFKTYLKSHEFNINSDENLENIKSYVKYEENIEINLKIEKLLTNYTIKIKDKYITRLWIYKSIENIILSKLLLRSSKTPIESIQTVMLSMIVTTEVNSKFNCFSIVSFDSWKTFFSQIIQNFCLFLIKLFSNMSSFDSRLFITINKREKNHLICNICLNIFDNAVTTDCGHTFCNKCVQQLIENNRKQCPECRQQLKNKRTIGTVNQNNLVIICGYIFTRNLMVNSMVNELIVKCKYELNGCKQTMELSWLNTHLKECEHRMCKICDLTIDEENGDHNCLERLKSERNRLDLKLDKTEKEKTELKRSVDQLLNTIKFKVEYIMFGTHLADPQTIEICGTLLYLTSTISFFAIIHLIMHCLEPTLPFVVIQFACHQITSIYDFNQIFKLKDRSIGWFDVESEGNSHYIELNLN